MEIVNLIISNTVFLAAVGVFVWMTKKWWLEWMSQSVRIKFEEKLEQLRGDIRAQETEFSSTRETALSNFRNIQAATVQRRLKAVDDLWEAVNDWNQFNWTLMIMSIIKFEDIAEKIERDPNVKEWAHAMLANAPTDVKGIGATANSARPHLNDMTWALYSAYQMLFGWAATQAHMLKIGGDFQKFTDSKGLEAVLIKALPDKKSYILTSSPVAHVYLPELLRERILAELRASLAGKEEDQISIDRASSVNQAIKALQTEEAELKFPRPDKK